jgi:hypothetical protein
MRSPRRGFPQRVQVNGLKIRRDGRSESGL